MYFIKIKEYIPVIFSKEENRNKKMINLQPKFEYKYTWDGKDSQLTFDNLFANADYKVSAKRMSYLYCGNGIIYNRVWDNEYSFYCVVCSMMDIDVLTDELKPKLMFLVSKDIPTSLLGRLKKMMNANGFNSRKQIKIVDDLTSIFVFDPLKPTFNAQLPETKKRTSNEFIIKMRNDG